LVVQSSARDAEHEDEFNRWYREEHLPDICAIPGFVGARRFRVRQQRSGAAVAGYLAVYELDSDDLEATVAEMSARSADGRVRRSATVQLDPPPVVTLYELID
jgi:hypothetical protein